ncbi:MAG: hypothetical protein IJZ37_03605 [Clostridia bacterium]|nr:hypothetical protein [Clostridia bacterium]MBQ8399412.1 hypothetical protein [Clostridia bacterium]
MKKSIYPFSSLLMFCILPLFAFAEEGTSAGSFQKILDVIWYIILAVLFGGGLILVSKWSKKINERDQELQEQLEEEMAAQEEEFEETEEEAPGKENEEEQSSKESE